MLDDLSTGFAANIDAGATLVEGSVADEAAVGRAIAGCEIVFHEAAHKAVLRSVERPLTTDTANTHGTLTVLKAAADAGVRRVVHASSSSVYGGATTVPTPESEPLVPRSPYAVTKLAAEHYCRVFAELYGLETVALRYFNVYGPRQRPDATYAAVIPLFVDALLRGRDVEVHGDGLQCTRFHLHRRRRPRQSRGRVGARGIIVGERLQHRGGKVGVAARHPRHPRRIARRHAHAPLRRAAGR